MLGFEKPNVEYHRRGEAVFELMPWLSADAGKSNQMVAVPIFSGLGACPTNPILAFEAMLLCGRIALHVHSMEGCDEL